MITAILFDFDGTLTRPDGLDFGELRRVTGCPAGMPILEYIATITEPAEQKRVNRALYEAELAAARHSQPNPGADQVIDFCRVRGLQMGIITRNALECVRVSLRNFDFLNEADFSVMVSRDDKLSPKPSPAGVHFAAEQMGISTRELLVVGDYLFDIDAGQAAGAMTAYITNRDPEPTFNATPDFVIHELPELLELPILRK